MDSTLGVQGSSLPLQLSPSPVRVAIAVRLDFVAHQYLGIRCGLMRTAGLYVVARGSPF